MVTVKDGHGHTVVYMFVYIYNNLNVDVNDLSNRRERDNSKSELFPPNWFCFVLRTVQ